MGSAREKSRLMPGTLLEARHWYSKQVCFVAAVTPLYPNDKVLLFLTLTMWGIAMLRRNYDAHDCV